MKFLSITSLLFLSGSVTALWASSSSSQKQQQALGEAEAPGTKGALDVPGENTLTYCKEPKDYIFDIEYVDLSPNPPVPGQNLTIKASGTSSKTIVAGAKLFVSVKLGFITIIRKEYDFCDAIDAVDLSCPLEKGPRTLEKVVAIPAQIPPGKYSVNADAYTEDHEEGITCLEGSIVF